MHRFQNLAAHCHTKHDTFQEKVHYTWKSLLDKSYQQMQILRNSCTTTYVTHNRYFTYFEVVNLEKKVYKVHYSLNDTLSTPSLQNFT